MTMNYSILLSTCYQNLLDADIDEIPYWQNMADNLKALQQENFVRVDVGNAIMNYLFEKAFEMNLNDLEFQMVRTRYEFYIKQGRGRETAFTISVQEVLSN